MRTLRLAAFLAFAAAPLAPGRLAAQHEGHAGHVAPASPYADLVDRPVKALSAEETRQLLEGEGMGMALTAELNGLPGPRHVLEMAGPLALTDAQRAGVEALFEAMRADAVALGRRVVEGEAALDAAFREAASGARPGDLGERVAALGRLRGELRAVHLLAHLATADLLTPGQVEAYGRLRGYGAAG